MKRRPTRREVVKLCGGGLAASVFPPAVEGVVKPGRVAMTGVDPGTVSREACLEAVARAVSAAIGVEPARRALGRLFGGDDTVGIKVNSLGGAGMSPRVELVEALVELLVEAGVARQRIIVFDRSSRELERAGYTICRRGGRYLCYGIDNDYERLPSTSGAIGSCFARLATSACTALISFGVVKDHDLAGVSAGLKNWYGVIHNPNKYHDSNCDPYVADVVRYQAVRSKLRLTVLDGIQAQCHGGPALYRGGLFPLGLVAASTDPVAADAWAWRMIDHERTRRGMESLEDVGRPPSFIATAGRYGLGVADPEKGEWVRV